jgi:hypothetical protein
MLGQRAQSVSVAAGIESQSEGLDEWPSLAQLKINSESVSRIALTPKRTNRLFIACDPENAQMQTVC